MNPVRDELLTVAQDLHLRCAPVGLQILAGPKLRERLRGAAHHQKLRGVSDARRKRIAEAASRRFANPVSHILIENKRRLRRTARLCSASPDALRSSGRSPG